MLLCRSFVVAILCLSSAASAIEIADLAALPDPLRSEVMIVDQSAWTLRAVLPSAEPSRDVLIDRATRRIFVADTGWYTRSVTEPGSVTIWQVGSLDGVDEASSPMGALLEAIRPVAQVPVGIAPIALALDRGATASSWRTPGAARSR